MNFQALPDVLQDLVCLFCFNLPLKAVRNGVNKILEIKDICRSFSSARRFGAGKTSVFTQVRQKCGCRLNILAECIEICSMMIQCSIFC